MKGESPLFPGQEGQEAAQNDSLEAKEEGRGDLTALNMGPTVVEDAG